MTCSIAPRWVVGSAEEDGRLFGCEVIWDISRFVLYVRWCCSMSVCQRRQRLEFGPLLHWHSKYYQRGIDKTIRNSDRFCGSYDMAPVICCWGIFEAQFVDRGRQPTQRFVRSWWMPLGMETMTVLRTSRISHWLPHDVISLSYEDVEASTSRRFILDNSKSQIQDSLAKVRFLTSNLFQLTYPTRISWSPNFGSWN